MNRETNIYGNILEALRKVNKQTKALSICRQNLKTHLNNGFFKVEDYPNSVDVSGLEELNMDSWFPCWGPYGEEYYHFKELNAEIRKHENIIYEYSLFIDGIIDRVDDPTINTVADALEAIEFFQEGLEALEKLKTELEETQTNRIILKNRLRELREEQAHYYELKDMVLHILNPPITEIHCINGKYYDYYVMEDGGKEYKFHRVHKGRIDDEDKIKEISYFPSVDNTMDRPEVELAVKLLEEYVASNKEKLVGYAYDISESELLSFSDYEDCEDYMDF